MLPLDWKHSFCITLWMRYCLFAPCFVLFTLFSWAKSPDPFTNPFDNPVDDPDLPRVLIIGDSISIGYTPRVRKFLQNKANVHRTANNCRWSAFGEENIDEWIGESKWDLIHFNFGLWDWYRWKQEQKATPASYAKNLDGIVRKLKKTQARLVFAVTTPPCLGPERKAKIVVSEARANELNKVAIQVMINPSVFRNDLYSLVGKNRAKYQRGENDVHYTEEGRDLLAKQVADVIEKLLTK